MGPSHITDDPHLFDRLSGGDIVCRWVFCEYRSALLAIVRLSSRRRILYISLQKRCVHRSEESSGPPVPYNLCYDHFAGDL